MTNNEIKELIETEAYGITYDSAFDGFNQSLAEEKAELLAETVIKAIAEQRTREVRDKVLPIGVTGFMKVYQDKNNLDTFFVERLENLATLLACEETKNAEREAYLPLVFEPVFMTEKEFLELPKFDGF